MLTSDIVGSFDDTKVKAGDTDV